MEGTTPSAILDLAFLNASARLSTPIITAPAVYSSVEFVCRNLRNRSAVRVLLSSSLAKLHNPAVDIRKPYTEIGDRDAALDTTSFTLVRSELDRVWEISA